MAVSNFFSAFFSRFPAWNKAVFFLLLFLFSGKYYAQAQSGVMRKYLIYFADKNNSPYSLSNPRQFLTARSLQRRSNQNISLNDKDLPVNPAYIATLAAVPGVKVWYRSKWLNAAVIECDTETLPLVNALPIIRRNARLSYLPKYNSGSIDAENCFRSSNTCSITQTDTLNYGAGANQIKMLGADSMHARGYTGKGKIIAVFDAGFQNVGFHQAFDSLRARHGVLGAYDFVNRDSSLFDGHPHGAWVLSLIAANHPGHMIGTGYGVQVYLFRTEDDATEKRIELANWLVAAERADSLGVDIISSSLGYSDGLTDPTQDYTFADMNGKTTPASLAAAHAASVGILVVNSAGNQGNDPTWGGHIAAPSDADSIITAGAADPRGGYASFSSRGPTSDGRIKPDLSAQGAGNVIIDPSSNSSYSTGSGTSFACPLLSGFAASFWQAHPGLTNLQVIATLKASANQAAAPDNLLGWGIPNFIVAQRILGVMPASEGKVNLFSVFPNPAAGSEVSVKTSYTGLGTLALYNLQGQLMKQSERYDFSASESVVFKLPAGLPPGIYTLECSGFKGREMHRIVKQ